MIGDSRVCKEQDESIEHIIGCDEVYKRLSNECKDIMQEWKVYKDSENIMRIKVKNYEN